MFYLYKLIVNQFIAVQTCTRFCVLCGLAVLFLTLLFLLLGSEFKLKQE